MDDNSIYLNIQGVENQLIFASSLNVIDINVQSDSCTLELFVYAPDSLQQIFKNKYYTTNNNVKISGLHDIINMNIKAAGVPLRRFLMEITAVINEIEQSRYYDFYAVYCADYIYSISAQNFFTENFASASNQYTLYKNCPAIINLIYYPGENIDINIEIHTGDKETPIITSQLREFTAQEYGYTSELISYDLIKDIIYTATDSKSITPSYATIRAGRRRITLFLQNRYIKYNDILQPPTFLFRNRFNAPETLALQADISYSNKTKYSTAQLLNVKSQYDRSTEISYEVQVDNLLPLQALSISEMMAAEAVYLISHDFNDEVSAYYPEDENFRQILIQDTSTSISQTASELASVKFSWSFCSNIAHHITPNTRLFNNIFSSQFC